MTDIRDRLGAFLRDRPCNMIELACQAGLTPSQLEGVLCKRRVLRVSELFGLCEALRLTPGELYRYN